MSLDDSLIKVFRETQFYTELCSELLLFVARADVYCWLNTDQEITYKDLKEEFLPYESLNPLTMLEALETLKNLRTLVGKVIRFFSAIYPLASRLEGITNWRWWHVYRRAVHWRKIARSFDWSEYLLITPARYEDEEWWNGEISTTSINPYLVL